MPGRRGSKCCCGSECFLPCDCFARNCELELDISGWLDNAATDCAGIANLTFNGTHRVSSLDLTSSSPYGFQCDFTLTFDAPVLTKEVGGNCVCKTQPALYEIDGILGCVDEGGGKFGLRLTLYFRVPVYDENAGCSPSPCTVEPKWEVWTWDYFVATNVSGGSPICTLGSNGFGPATINGSAPAAQTTCGLGLDGTNATIAIRFVLCDPVSVTCATCCNEDLEQIPDSVQVVISGMANGQIGAPADGVACDDCPSFDGTYILERVSGACVWTYSFDESPCSSGIPPTRLLGMTLFVVENNGTCNWQLLIRMIEDPTSPERNVWLYAAFCDDGAGYDNGDKCSDWDGTVLNACDGFDAWCDYTAATATITALP